MSKLTYCAPSWSGACSATDRAKLNRSAATTSCHTVNLSVMPMKVFQTRHHPRWTCSPVTVPDRSAILYSIRKRTHNKTLIPKTTQLNDDEFLIRMLYKDVY